MTELKFLEANRTVDRKHVEQIKQSILEVGYLSEMPILVNEEGFIIDGQHRYVACKELGIEPKYTTVTSISCDTDKMLLALNTNSKSWTLSDYVTFYAQKGNSYYLELIRLSKRYSVSYTTMLVFITNQPSSRSISTMIKNNNLVFDYSEKALKQLDDKIKSVMRMYRILNYSNSTRLLPALIVAYNHPHFVVDTFIEKVNKQRDKIYKCNSSEAYMMMIENVYNYNARKKINITGR